MQKDIKQALETLRSGGIILYPTDTIWGIGCDATNAEAVEKVNKLKGRTKDKNLIILLENENNITSYVSEVPDVAYELIEFTEEPLTIIYSGAKNLPLNLVAENETIGIRIVRDDFCRELIRRFRKPIVSTSANFSGQPSAKTFSEIDQGIIDGVDYVVNYQQDNLEIRAASTIIKLGPSGQFELIRKS